MTMKLHVAYPNGPTARFDFDYYRNTHMPMVMERFGPAGMTDFSATRGGGGKPDDAPPPFVLLATLTFPDEASLDAALAVAEPLIADIANFTNVEPHFMIGSVLD